MKQQSDGRLSAVVADFGLATHIPMLGSVTVTLYQYVVTYCAKFFTCRSVSQLWYRDCIANTIEENFSVFSVI